MWRADWNRTGPISGGLPWGIRVGFAYQIRWADLEDLHEPPPFRRGVGDLLAWTEIVAEHDECPVLIEAVDLNADVLAHEGLPRLFDDSTNAECGVEQPAHRPGVVDCGRVCLAWPRLGPPVAAVKEQ